MQEVERREHQKERSVSEVIMSTLLGERKGYSTKSPNKRNNKSIDKTDADRFSPEQLPPKQRRSPDKKILYDLKQPLRPIREVS